MEEQILNLRKNKLSINQIAKELRLSTIRISEILRKNNLINSPNRVKLKPSKYNIDENFFKKIDTEQKAYVLGFLYADGCISENKNSFSIGLKKQDEKILLEILKVMQSNQILYYHKSRYSNKNKYTEKACLNICNKILHTDLINLGLTPRKSLTLVFPSTDILPINLQRHFMRGYFDGDGSIYITQQSFRVNLISTKEFCDTYLNILPTNNVNIRKENRTIENVWYFVIAKLNDIESIYKFFYENATIFLDRKKNKFDEFIKTKRPSTTIIRKPEMVMV